jgi:hypothetical protein
LHALLPLDAAGRACLSPSFAKIVDYRDITDYHKGNVLRKYKLVCQVFLKLFQAVEEYGISEMNGVEIELYLDLRIIKDVLKREVIAVSASTLLESALAAFI